MKHAFFLAWRNLAASRIRTVILVTCLTLSTSLPLVMHVVADQFQRGLQTRAEQTPLIVGATGSRVELALHVLYFDTDAPGEITLSETDFIRGTGYAIPVPIYARFRAEGFRIVGTTEEYFSLRGLTVARGQSLKMPGDCLIGATVAKELRIGTGDQLTSEPENLFDPSGSYPLRMKVRGILGECNSPDDNAIFVSLETAWIIAGHGHGHSNPTDKTHQSTVGDDGSSVPVHPFIEVTQENVSSFHFHGQKADLPLTAVIALCPDPRSGTLLTGRYLTRDTVSILDPLLIIEELMQLVFHVERFLDAGASLLISTTLLLVVLVFSLSWKLRQRETRTLFQLGCSRFTIARLFFAEVVLIALFSFALLAPVAGVAVKFGPQLLEGLVLEH